MPVSLALDRLSGTAHDADGIHPWSLILKGSSGAAQSGNNDPTQLMYWKREVLALQSGLLYEPPGSLSAPRCYGIVERPNDTVWLWLEDIQESSAPWTVARYGLAAVHLGQFNGASLAGSPSAGGVAVVHAGAHPSMDRGVGALCRAPSVECRYADRAAATSSQLP